jgi:toxin-antitoxin system PIN domain toxin
VTSHLLDASVLIALVVEEHEHHERAFGWAASVDRMALCPIVEGALVRFLVRIGERPATARDVLQALSASGRCETWPDSISYAQVPMEHVIGHRQVTDAYLAALAAANGGRLATFDAGLAVALPERVDLIP